jgi:hypothetical protein
MLVPPTESNHLVRLSDLRKPGEYRVNIADYIGSGNYTWAELMHAYHMAKAEYGFMTADLPANRISNPTDYYEIRGVDSLNIIGPGTFGTLYIYNSVVFINGEVQFDVLVVDRQSTVDINGAFTVTGQLTATRQSTIKASCQTFRCGNIKAERNSCIDVSAAKGYLGPLATGTRALYAETYSWIYIVLSKALTFYSASDAAVTFMEIQTSMCQIAFPESVEIEGPTPSSMRFNGLFGAQLILYADHAWPNMSTTKDASSFITTR